MRAEENSMPEKATILVIDDEKTIQDSCCKVLARSGYRTETAGDGESGLQKIKEVRPDLVLVDLKMPGMGGMELLERIEEVDPAIVSVVITGYATIELAVEAMKRNAYDFLSKPFTPDQLRIVTERGLERRRLALETARLQHEKERMRENFVTLVSHQLRSPLVSIQQYFEVILEGFAGDVAGKQREMLEDANSRIMGLLKLINDWLDMSRIEAGKIIEKIEPVDLVAVFSEIMEILEPLSGERKVTLEIDLRDGLPLVRGDRVCLKQAFMNLVSNGIAYNREGGTVKVSSREEGDNLVVEIADTGIGISQENLHFIFEEFFRVKSGDTRGITGCGLGLPIAKKIIEAHNGSIDIFSELGRGTTLTVLLPKAGAEQGGGS